MVENWNFYVEGVRCSKCVQKLENLEQEHSELSEAQFNKSKNLLTTKSTDQITPQNIIQWIEAKGYKAYFVENFQQAEEKRLQTQRQWLIRLAVTFFFASNIMMFSFALYLGASDEWVDLFHWLCGILFIPILTYSATPFYKNAWNSLKEKQFSADLAIVIAFTWGSLFNYFNLWRGSSEFYFDSTAAFIFLILLARYYLHRAQNSIEMDLNPSLLFKTNPFFKVVKNNQTHEMLYHKISAGDIITIVKGQTIPTDIKLDSPFALVDASLYSGESYPQTFRQNQTIKAGMVAISDSITGVALNHFNQSELYEIFENVIRNRHQKTKAHSRAEKYSQYLLTTVSFLSLATLIFFGVQAQWAEGFQRALALFTIACPCSLALGVPLASIMTLKRSMEIGLFSKTPLFFERLPEVDTIVFDKTGTLTKGAMEFHSWEPEMPDSNLLSLLLSMEMNSKHPLAKSLTRYLFSLNVSPIPLDEIVETPGVGVSAIYKQNYYCIRSIQNPIYKNLTGFELTCNSEVVLTAYFKDQVKPEAKLIVSKLQKLNFSIFLLSGDRSDVVYEIAKELNLNPENCIASLSPQEKSDYIDQLQTIKNKKCLMIGDGHNDALALSKAFTSIAVQGSTETSLKAADTYAQNGNLMQVFNALKLSRFYQFLIKQNIGLSLGYNFIAGCMALLGLVNPLVAAILMPINSIFVISATALAQPPKKGIEN